jgi:DNA-binding CsgD family transcriptional regulator
VTVLDRVQRLCGGGLGLDELRDELDAVLRPHVGWDSVAWSTMDPASVIVSRRYQTILRPLGATDDLRAAFVSGGSCWGTLTAYRADGAFSPVHVELVEEVGGAIAEGMRLAILRIAAQHPERLDDPPELLLVAPGDAGDDWPPELGPAIRAVAARVAKSAGPASARLRGPDGAWLVLHGSRVPGDERVAVIVERARALRLASVITRACGLSDREREVVELVARGYASKLVAAALGISAHTVDDHLKSIYAKTGTHSRGELLSLLFTSFYQPRVVAGVPPGPYGWFLE